MLLSEFFDYLSCSGFSQYSIGTDDAGRIANKDYPRVLLYINAGLTKLHTKLLLKQKQLHVQLSTARTWYELSSKFSVSGNPDGGEDIYIFDSQTPFVDDLLLVEGVVSSDGYEYILNDRDTDKPIFTPKYNAIQLAEPTNDLVAVLYRANHEKFPLKRNIVLEDYVIDLPDYLIETLSTYCTYLLLNSSTGMESQQEAIGYLSLFERQLDEVIQEGLTPEVVTQSVNFKEGRWV